MALQLKKINKEKLGSDIPEQKIKAGENFWRSVGRGTDMQVKDQGLLGHFFSSIFKIFLFF